MQVSYVKIEHNTMVSTIDEILEKSRRDTVGVSFEEALKETRELKYSSSSKC